MSFGEVDPQAPRSLEQEQPIKRTAHLIDSVNEKKMKSCVEVSGAKILSRGKILRNVPGGSGRFAKRSMRHEWSRTSGPSRVVDWGVVHRHPNTITASTRWKQGEEVLYSN